MFEFSPQPVRGTREDRKREEERMPKAPLKPPPKKHVGVEKPAPDPLLDSLSQGAPEHSNPTLLPAPVFQRGFQRQRVAPSTGP